MNDKMSEMVARKMPLSAGTSIVVPVFQSSTSLEILKERVVSALCGRNFEVLLVDDGSDETTWASVKAVVSSDARFRGIRLSRNFGQHSALVAGVRAARFETTVTIDDDLQNPPEEITKLLERLDTSQADVVYGVSPLVRQSLGRRIAGRITRRTLKSGLGIASAPQMSSFRAFRTELREGFAGEIGTNVSLDALLTWAASRYDHVNVRHDPREFGSSTYSMKKLVRFAIDSMTGYSTLPLQIASLLGLATALFGVIVLLFVTLRPLIQGASIPGFPFLASTVAIFSGVQLLTLGVIGEYLARMHFRIMNKPTYVISEMAIPNHQAYRQDCTDV
ncbi:MAG: glycosyltransferase [Actinomycetes bacterium]